jgi:hypothetical protein
MAHALQRMQNGPTVPRRLEEQMADAAAFTKLVPGFDFLQSLVKNAGSALPSIGQWVAPTLSPEELDKRIEELRTVQFWLEQNARMLGATIQALEVQRMTLSTLRTMNVQMDDLRESLKIRVPSAPAPARAPAKAELEDTPEEGGNGAKADKPPKKAARPSKKAEAASAAGPVDPMQWWGALTKQFTELAASAMKETTADAAKNLAGAIKQGAEAGGQNSKKAAEMPARAARKSAGPARKRAVAKSGT